MALTAAEQYLLELINRGRLDPKAEAKRYGVDLNDGLDPGEISTSSKQVLAHNTVLEDAAAAHSDWMLEKNTFSHTGVSQSSPGARMEDAGYAFEGDWSWRENLAWTGSTTGINLADAIEQHHEGLFLSSGHRANTFAENLREVGIAQVKGDFTQQGTTFEASMLTVKFAASGADLFVTGVAYDDQDGDGFYSIGEGNSNAWIKVDGTDQDAGRAGGFGVAVQASEAVEVTLGQGAKRLAELTVDTTQGNAKVDMVRGQDGGWVLDLSGSADLIRGISDARLLGLNDLDLTGSKAANELTGNRGANTLDGGAGRDTLDGGGGHDTLIGGKGHDTLIGGQGRDTLTGDRGRDTLDGGRGRDTLEGGAGRDRLDGGGGADTFVFSGGKDTILDFKDNTDTIAIDQSRVGPDVTIQDILDLGKIKKGDAVFSFGKHELKIKDVDDLEVLANDLIIL